jgi:hypothetical protein
MRMHGINLPPAHPIKHGIARQLGTRGKGCQCVGSMKEPAPFGLNCLGAALNSGYA